MAEDIENVTTSAPARRPSRAAYPGPSPLSTGLLYGAGAGAVAGGPIGALVGLGFGILAKKLKDNYLDREAVDIENIEAERLETKERLDKEYALADPDEKRLLDQSRQLATDGYYRLMSGDTQAGMQMIQQANTISAGIIGADSQARKQDEAQAMQIQRNLISTAANSYRGEYQGLLAQHDTVNTQADRVLDLVNSPGFDPNKPFNKAILAELLTTGIGGMYRDAPDILDAVSEGSNALAKIPVVGQYAPDIVKGIATAVKAQDFKVTAEDYNRIALNMKKFSEKFATGRMGEIGSQAQQLDQYARKTKTISNDYSLADYISGGIKELRLTPVPKLTTTAPATSAAGPLASIPYSAAPLTPSAMLGKIAQWRAQKQQKRPTN